MIVMIGNIQRRILRIQQRLRVRSPSLTVIRSAAVLLLAIAWAPAGCSRSNRLSGEHNPYFVRGLALRKQNRYAEAAEAFEKCLRLSPDAVEAHLQLATLYDDHLNDHVRALVHYRAYLARNPDASNRKTVEDWIRRTEIRLLDEYARKHPDEFRKLAREHAPRPARPTAREEYLARRVKELTAEVEALKAELREVLRARAPETPAPATAAPRSSAGPASAASATRAEAAPQSAGAGGQQTAKTESSKTYVVEEGDTLTSIARRFYGKGTKWTVIYEANRDVLSSPDRLPVGVRLRIPQEASR